MSYHTLIGRCRHGNVGTLSVKLNQILSFFMYRVLNLSVRLLSLRLLYGLSVFCIIKLSSLIAEVSLLKFFCYFLTVYLYIGIYLAIFIWWKNLREFVSCSVSTMTMRYASSSRSSCSTSCNRYLLDSWKWLQIFLKGNLLNYRKWQWPCKWVVCFAWNSEFDIIDIQLFLACIVFENLCFLE